MATDEDKDVPAGWIRRESKSRPGHFFYFNPETGQSTWRKPKEKSRKQDSSLKASTSSITAHSVDVVSPELPVRSSRDVGISPALKRILEQRQAVAARAKRSSAGTRQKQTFQTQKTTAKEDSPKSKTRKAAAITSPGRISKLKSSPIKAAHKIVKQSMLRGKPTDSVVKAPDSKATPTSKVSNLSSLEKFTPFKLSPKKQLRAGSNVNVPSEGENRSVSKKTGPHQKVLVGSPKCLTPQRVLKQETPSKTLIPQRVLITPSKLVTPQRVPNNDTPARASAQRVPVGTTGKTTRQAVSASATRWSYQVEQAGQSPLWRINDTVKLTSDYTELDEPSEKRSAAWPAPSSSASVPGIGAHINTRGTHEPTDKPSKISRKRKKAKKPTINSDSGTSCDVRPLDGSSIRNIDGKIKPLDGSSIRNIDGKILQTVSTSSAIPNAGLGQYDHTKTSSNIGSIHQNKSLASSQYQVGLSVSQPEAKRMMLRDPVIFKDNLVPTYSWNQGDTSCQSGAAAAAPAVVNSISQEETDMDVDPVHTDISQMRQAGMLWDHAAVTGQLTQHVTGDTDVGTGHQGTSQGIYLVLDTNVLMQQLKFLAELKDMSFSGVGRPIYVVPWVVMQELDVLKDSKHKKKAAFGTQLKARYSVRYLNQQLETHHPGFHWQTPQQARDAQDILKAENNDDRVLLCCLQWQSKYPQSGVTLLTEDVNLRSKALIMHIQAFSYEKITPYLQNLHPGPTAAASSTQDSGMCSNQAPQPSTSRQQPTTKQKQKKPAASVAKVDTRAKLADEMLCSMKTVLKNLLSDVLEFEMKTAYDDLWQHIVFRKPPWTLQDILESFDKHWIAVFGQLMPRGHKNKLSFLMTRLNKGYGVTVTETSDMLVAAEEFCQDLPKNSSYASAKKNCCKSLEDLQRLCRQVLTESLTAEEALSRFQLGHDPPHGNANVGEKAAASQDADQFMAAGSPGNPPEKTPTENEVMQKVQQQFQASWEAIISTKECLADILMPATGEMTTLRLEALQFFSRLVKILMALDASYKSMMGANVMPNEDQLQPFTRFSLTLNMFAKEISLQPWEEMKPEALLCFYSNPQGHEMLKNGYLQLNSFCNDLELLWGTLGPEEQVIVKGNS